MTLADVLSSVRQLNPSDKLKLIRILAEELDTGEDVTNLLSGKVCDLPTPYDSFGAAQILAEALEKAPDKSD
jgi:hypothetical protein